MRNHDLIWVVDQREIVDRWSDSISEFQILGVGGVKCRDSSSQESWSGEMRNVEIRWSDSISGLPIPGLGGVRKSSQQGCRLQNAKPWLNLSRWSKGDHGPLIWLHFIVLDTRSWRCQGHSRQEWWNSEMWNHDLIWVVDQREFLFRDSYDEGSQHSKLRSLKWSLAISSFP